MTMNKKIGILSLACALCLTVGTVSVNMTTASAAGDTTAVMTMLSGAAVNKTTDYGGIRWATTVDQGFMVDGETSLSFGTFVMPTATYNAEKATKDVNEMTGVMNLQYQKGAKQDTTNFDKDGLTFYSAISYDTIVADYKAAYPNTQKDDEEIAKQAYKLELTAISYATDGTNYVFVENADTSRSARQVANMAILAGELDNKVEQSQKDKINAYVGTRYADGKTSTGYLDLTDIENGTAQTITSNLTELNQSWGNVEEIVVGAKRIDKVVDVATNTITINAVPSNIETYENEEFTYVSAFTADGVYTLPVIAADVLINSWADVVNKLGNEALTEGGNKTQSGYYVITQDIVAEEATKHLGRVDLGANKTAGLFNATLDGLGHKISGFTTDRGLFGYVRNSTVKNLGIEGSRGTVNGECSLVANSIYDSTFDNVYVKTDESLAKVSNANSGYSPIGYRLSGVTFKNCLIDSTFITNQYHYTPYWCRYHQNAPASVSTGGVYTNVSYDNTYVLSGLPLVYQSTTGNVKASCEDTTVTSTETFFYVKTGKLYDTLAEIDVLGDKSVAITGTDLTGATTGSYPTTVREAENNGKTVLRGKTSKGYYSITFDTESLKVTKGIYYTGYTSSKNAHNRYYYYDTYTQITTGVKRYVNAGLMGEEAETNATSLNTFNKYWTVSGGTLTFGN